MALVAMTHARRPAIGLLVSSNQCIPRQKWQAKKLTNGLAPEDRKVSLRQSFPKTCG
jgi:hypothetical protein